MKTNLDSNYWQNRYEELQTGWDLGAVSPPLKAYFQQLSNKELKLLVPGCGNAYEAEYLWQNGFRNVFVADLAEAPLAALKARIPDFPEAQLLHQDFFLLQDTFDLIIEQTFFCAIEPRIRPDYAIKAFELLKPGGKLVGLLFNTEFPQAGPPFGGTENEYRTYFEPFFHFRTFATATNSIKPRAGKELFMILERKGI
ncbi:methyltransferase domain-containing protein [Adhaeribacter soli]|uniref:Methyltransferase domain-containing protein n=1 Tax=Adhaeribacter soli TaxID=2607655 RepID=A0A5N1J4Y4_9BACT|nr:methyltransferase domain-containing protein [Adhaeribacter soli]KAA9345971.1 methyltransferase domain-containing protein [Adhaeribacter soli]